jgi:hypothetical protein
MKPAMELGSEFRAHATGDDQYSKLFDPVQEITSIADSGCLLP